MALVAVADHRKIASERSVEVALGELAEIGIELVPGEPAAVTVDALEEDEEPGLENFAVASVKPEGGDPAAAVVVAEEERASLAFASAAEEEEGSVLALAAAVDVAKGRPVPEEAPADKWVALAFGAAAAADAAAAHAEAEAEAAYAEGAGATVAQSVASVGTAAEGAGLVV